MPTYVYETIPDDGAEPVRFEVQQRMADPPLEVHPDTGAPVKRVMTAANLGGVAAGKWSQSEAPAAGCGMGSCGAPWCGSGEA